MVKYLYEYKRRNFTLSFERSVDIAQKKYLKPYAKEFI